MKQITFLFITVGVLALVLQGCAGMMGAGPKVSHAHIGHVHDGWKDTPDKVGLINILEQEIKIAVQHSGFSIKRGANLAWMKTHVRHVRHAVDPSTEPTQKVGKGYGVLKAAKGVADHIGFAAAADGASKNVKAHAVHVKASAENVEALAKRIIKLSKSVLAAESADVARPGVEMIEELSQRMWQGFDANLDGSISWKKGEGGLRQAQAHMGFMRKGEGMG